MELAKKDCRGRATKKAICFVKKFIKILSLMKLLTILLVIYIQVLQYWSWQEVNTSVHIPIQSSSLYLQVKIWQAKTRLPVAWTLHEAGRLRSTISWSAGVLPRTQPSHLTGEGIPAPSTPDFLFELIHYSSIILQISSSKNGLRWGS